MARAAHHARVDDAVPIHKVARAAEIGSLDFDRPCLAPGRCLLLRAATMRPMTSRVRRFAVAIAVLTIGAGCAQKLASLPRPSLEGCGGLFTAVALPYVTRGQERALEAAVPHLTARALHLRLRANYYRVLDAEQGGAPGAARDAYVMRMLSEERAPPGLLAGVRLRALRFAVAPPAARRRALRQAVLHARAPLARRLDRVAARLASAAGVSDVVYRLDARLQLNAGAEVGFTSRRILVGPSLVLLAESEDALAFVVGHELAHVVHHHTMLKAAQDLFIHTLTFGYGSGDVGEALAGILSQGSMPAFNRDKECEADYYALQYMRAAGYRPAAAAELWKTVLALRPVTSHQKIPFVSGHPPEAERVLRLAAWADVDLLRAATPMRPPDPPLAEDAASASPRDVSPEDAIASFGVVLK